MTITNAELLTKCVQALRIAFHSARPQANFGYAEVRAVLAVLAEPGNITHEMFDAFDAAPLSREYPSRTGPHFAVKVAIAAAIGSILK